MPSQNPPAVFGSIFCTRCGKRLRGPNHVCQPSATDRFQRQLEWSKRSLAASQPAKKK